MASTRILSIALLTATLVTFGATGSAMACHDGECSSAASPVSLGFIAANLVLLGVDADYVVNDARPGRSYGAAEVAIGLIQYPVAFALTLDEGHDYGTWAGVQAAVATAVVAHGAYVLIRGGKADPSRVGFAPTASPAGVGAAVFGRF